MKRRKLKLQKENSEEHHKLESELKELEKNIYLVQFLAMDLEIELQAYIFYLVIKYHQYLKELKKQRKKKTHLKIKKFKSIIKLTIYLSKYSIYQSNQKNKP